MRKVLIIDTSILCIWLGVPGFETCGPEDDAWDGDRVAARVAEEERAGTTFVLPLATLIETGNHISHAAGNRFSIAQRLAELMRKTANGQTPWAAFVETTSLWSKDEIIRLADEWPELAKGKFSLGDATIKRVAEHYAGNNWQVEILTGDQGLQAYQPTVPVEQPRRRGG